MKYFTEEELWILNNDYGTACNLRAILLNLFNQDTYPRVRLRAILYSADEKHKELFWKILDTPLEYLDGCEIHEDIDYLRESNKNID